MSGELLSPASPSSSDPQQDLLRAAALQRQQEQYNQYVRAHRERTRGGGGGDGGPSSSRSSRSSSRSSSSTRSTRAHRDSQAASLYESQIGDLGDGAAEYHLSQEGQLAQHHQQSHGSSSTRASNWILTQVAWSDRTRIGSILMFIHILLYQSLAIAIIAIGRRHLHDTFYDPSSPSSSNTSHENTCAQLPLFLILAGVLFLVATVIVGAMITMAAAIARGSQPAKNALQWYERKADRCRELSHSMCRSDLT